MNAVMYIILASTETTPMSPGKAASQAAHAAVEAYRLTDPDSNLHKNWYVAGHYTKLVLQAPDLHVAERYLNDRGVKTALIIDEGRTEFNGVLTPTAIGCALVNKDNPHIQETFSAFSLYSGAPQMAVVEVAKPLKPAELSHVRSLLASGRPFDARRYLKALEGYQQDWSGNWVKQPKEPKRSLLPWRRSN